jgi:chromosome partitioning protein
VTEALTGYEIPVLRSQLCQRVSFAESAATGKTVFETDPNGTAAKEVKSLVNELIEVMG